jgi:hypothetical protein
MKPLRHILLFIALVVGGALAVATLSGCATSAAPASGVVVAAPASAVLATPAAKATALAATIDRNCQVGLPFLASLKAVQTDPAALALLDKVSGDADKVCAVAALVANPPLGTTPALDLAAVKTFASAQIPSLLTLVRTSKLDDNAKTAAVLAITGAQLALLNGVVGAQ